MAVAWRSWCALCCLGKLAGERGDGSSAAPCKVPPAQLLYLPPLFLPCSCNPILAGRDCRPLLTRRLSRWIDGGKADAQPHALPAFHIQLRAVLSSVHCCMQVPHRHPHWLPRWMARNQHASRSRCRRLPGSLQSLRHRLCPLWTQRIAAVHWPELVAASAPEARWRRAAPMAAASLARWPPAGGRPPSLCPHFLAAAAAPRAKLPLPRRRAWGRTSAVHDDYRSVCSVWVHGC